MYKIDSNGKYVKSSEYDGSMGWNPVDAVKDAYSAVADVVRSAADIARDTAVVQALDDLRDQAASTTVKTASTVATTVKTNEATAVTLDQAAALKAEALRFEEETLAANEKTGEIIVEKSTIVADVGIDATRKATEKAPKPVRSVVRGAGEGGLESGVLIMKSSHDMNVTNQANLTSAYLHSGSLAEVVSVTKDSFKTQVGTAIAPITPFTGRIMPKPKQEVQESAQGDPELEAAAREAELAEQEAQRAALEAQEMLKRKDLSAAERAEAELALANALKQLEAAKAASNAARIRLYGEEGVPKKKSVPPLAHPILVYELQAKQKKAALKAAKMEKVNE